MKKLIVLAIMLLMTLSVFAQGEVDWERRVVRAVGIGAPNPNAPNMAVKRAGAIRAAKLVALRELGETVKGMYLSGKTKVENFVTTNDEIGAQFEGILKSFRMIGGPKYFDDGSVEVTVEMSIDGDLANLTMPKSEFKEENSLQPTENFNNTQTGSESTTTTQNSGIFTGLIINCQEVNLRPALAPKVIDEDGREVYGTANVSREYAVQQGMMGYLKDLQKAAGNTRVGANPYQIKAINSSGTNKADIVISNADAQKVRELGSKLNFLRECRVIAVLK